MVQQVSWWRVLTRRKTLAGEGHDGDGTSKLNRVLGLYDLTALGVGSTLGAGVYVLAGQIARDQAGPSVMLSFAIAALASLLAGICYAEFGARVPRAGSAYVYSYVCIGEFAAFVIGWNLMLEYMIGTAAVCRGISLYLDTLIDDALKNAFATAAPMHVSFFGSYFDFLAFGLVVVFGVVLAFGVETSTMANNFCTCLNLLILLFVIVAGAIKANFANWTIDPATVPPTEGVDPNALGSGGYFPFGFSGTLRGAATCFFGFVGFDCIATTGEEVRNPRRNIPRSILLSLLVIFLCYFGVSTVLTLMVPYYQQDPNAPLPYAFKAVGWTFAMWIVSIGGMIGLLASLFGALFPLPRIMYSMAEDGLLFRFLGRVSPRFQVPVVGSIVAAVVTGVIAGLFDLAQLVNLLSIGTLLAYSVVAISVTILRYSDNNTSDESLGRGNGNSETSMLTSSGTRITCGSILKQLFNCKRNQTPSTLSTRIVGSLITLFCLLSMGIGLVFMQAYDALISNQVWVLVLLGVLVLLTALVLLAICLQPRESYRQVFRVPLVPLVPAISIFVNIYLMLQLDPMTWVRFGIWMAIGIPIFLACWYLYDNKNPAKRNPQRVEFERLLGDSSNDSKRGPPSIKVASEPAGKFSSATKVADSGRHPDDEIMNMNDVSDDLVEMKHANGKVFYIDESSAKSNRSTASTGSLHDDARKMATSATTLASSETTDDEKSVIAFLDDVLQAEDDGGSPPALASNTTPEFYGAGRRSSIDSEMMPSVIETTTVATVHSSSSCSSGDSDADAPPSPEPLDHMQRYAEARSQAVQLIEEIEASEEVQRVLNQQLREPESKEAPVTPTKAPMLRSNSIDSMLSGNSVQEDPLRSEKFKNKLSKLMLRPVSAVQQQQQPKEPQTPAVEEPKRESSARPLLKQSKSEADIRSVMLKAIEARRIDFEDESPADSAEPSDLRATIGPSQSAKASANNGIPKPPKFDPVLYKTLNSYSSRKVRPSLDKMAGRPLKVTVAEPMKEPEPDTAEPVPFKLKLEAILQRGPSHRTQKRPAGDQLIRPKSMVAPTTLVPEEPDRSSTVTVNEKVLRRLAAKSESNLSEQQDPAEAINNVRRTLRPVANGVINS